MVLTACCVRLSTRCPRLETEHHRVERYVVVLCSSPQAVTRRELSWRRYIRYEITTVSRYVTILKRRHDYGCSTWILARLVVFHSRMPVLSAPLSWLRCGSHPQLCPVPCDHTPTNPSDTDCDTRHNATLVMLPMEVSDDCGMVELARTTRRLTLHERGIFVHLSQVMRQFEGLQTAEVFECRSLNYRSVSIRQVVESACHG